MVKELNCFVFVVCGDKHYTDTLKPAISTLRRRSNQRIVVVTDSRRNQDTIKDAEIIDIATPTELNHHQASVFLKTSVNRYINTEYGLACYLDSDIVAIGENVDHLFSHYPGTIGFAADHMSLDLFSPYAAQCGCLEEARKKEKQLQSAQESYSDLLKSWNHFVDQSGGRELQALIGQTQRQWIKNFPSLSLYGIQRLLPVFRSAFLKRHYYNKSENAWFDSSGKKILYPILPYFQFIKEETGFRYHSREGFWFEGARKDVCIPSCDHLHTLIEKKSGIRIQPITWQHWNGGMFLFGKDSDAFLDCWHNSTMEIFRDSSWRTRDQGTLAMAAWKFGLQNRPVISSAFNYIIDSRKPGLKWGKQGFSRDKGINWDQPQLLHIYHRFGDEEWDFWQYIKEQYLSAV